MRYGVLGTGIVGQTIATKLVQLGHQVMMGSRTAGGDKAKSWAANAGDLATEGTFADAAGFAETIVNATAGGASIEALKAAGTENISNKVLIDIANPLVFGDSGMSLSVCNTDSLAEQIQREFPQARVVKSLNTMSATVMTSPAALNGDHNVFVAGNDAEAKSAVAMLLQSFGWPLERIIDIGDSSGARGLEAYLLLWIRLFQTTGSPDVNIALVKKS